MKKKYPTILILFTLIILSACGPAPAPTLSAADVEGTAIADAWISITLTQAAIPTATATLILPTATSLPTITPFPTLAAVVPTAVPATSAVDACDQPPPLEPKGSQVKVTFINKSGGNVNLSFGMNNPNTEGECITYSYTFGKFAEEVVTVLSGCYWAFGWVDGEQPSTAQTVDLLCVTDPNKAPAVWIGTEVIAFH